MLESSAVVVFSGIFRNPIIPKLINAVIVIGMAPINPILKFLNISDKRTITINNDRIKLIICPSKIKSVNTNPL